MVHYSAERAALGGYSAFADTKYGANIFVESPCVRYAENTDATVRAIAVMG